jgi:carbamoyl-phosphate synthase/aspartate carbamoyltransferase/dihydroorotase
MTTLRLPGLVDVHVHTRDPGQTHKETWASATAAALAGGFTTVLAMPNTRPAATDAASLATALAAARAGARCDYALYVGATTTNAAAVAALAPRTAGLKMYLNQTFGDLKLPDLDAWWDHLSSWPATPPLVVHAEGATLGAVLLMAEWLERPVHVCHVSRADEIRLIARARERGIAVTCEATPHHLFLDETALARLGRRAEVRPVLADPADRAALWDHLDVIDCFATDHAPHTAAEKDGADPPPGFPGLETVLPLLLGGVHDGRLTIDDLVARLSTNPRRIFGLPEPDAVVEVDPDETWTVAAADLQTACDWTPFEGMAVRGRVRRVEVRGSTVYEAGKVLANSGTGKNLREEHI